MKSILASDEQMYTSPPPYNSNNLPDSASLSTSPTSKLSSFKPYSQNNPPLRSEIDFNHSLATTSPPYQPGNIYKHTPNFIYLFIFILLKV